MAFRFDFDVEDDVCPGPEDCGKEVVIENEVDSVTRPPPTIEIPFSTSKDPDTTKALQLHLSDGSTLLYTDIRHLCHHGAAVNGDRAMETGIVSQSEAHHSDLIGGVYEGGLKIWECSLDLVDYLASLGRHFEGVRVMELGCGAGLPALYTAVKGAHIYLQDYNEDVIRQVTLPNVLLNSQGKDVKCKLYAGDWSDVGELVNSGANIYDVILTSETIYNTSSYEKLHDAMAVLLQPFGEVFVAAKTHYFGVGGGTDLFKEFVKNRGVFEITTVKQFDEGVKREIMRMVFHSSKTEVS